MIVKLKDLKPAKPVIFTEKGKEDINNTISSILSEFEKIPDLYFCLTANQIGIPHRIIGFKYPDAEPFFLFNPSFTPMRSRGMKRIWEMNICFEKGEKYRIRRFKRVKLFHDTIEGERTSEIVDKPKIAIAVQHCIDILNARKIWT